MRTRGCWYYAVAVLFAWILVFITFAVSQTAIVYVCVYLSGNSHYAVLETKHTMQWLFY